MRIGGAPPTGNVVIGNYIGTDATGTENLGNDYEGIVVRDGANGNRIGGTLPGEANLIAFNGSSGIAISTATTTGNSIRRNSIYSNGGLGIDLSIDDYSGDGVTANDINDPDTGGNNLQNYPVLTEAVNQGGSTNVTVSFNSTPGTQFVIEFFTSTSCNSSGYGEGQTYLGQTTRTTDASGNVNFTLPTTPELPLGTYITATASRTAAPLDTSVASPAETAASQSGAAVKFQFTPARSLKPNLAAPWVPFRTPVSCTRIPPKQAGPLRQRYPSLTGAGP